MRRRAAVATAFVASIHLVPGAAHAQEVVSFPTSDQGVVSAHQYGQGPRAVLLAHGGQFTKESWRDQALVLEGAGFRVLAIDFRGRGDSRGRPGSSPDDGNEHLDVLAAVEFLRDTGAESVSVVGASFGGWAAAKATTQLPEGEIEKLVLLAHSPIENPEELRVEKLFLIAEGDVQGSGTLRLPAVRDQFERSPEPKVLVVLEGSAHAQHVFAEREGARALREIVSFLLGPA